MAVKKTPKTAKSAAVKRDLVKHPDFKVGDLQDNKAKGNPSAADHKQQRHAVKPNKRKRNKGRS